MKVAEGGVGGGGGERREREGKRERERERERERGKEREGREGEIDKQVVVGSGWGAVGWGGFIK